MADKVFEANRLLRLWGRAIIDSELPRLGYDDMSPQEKLNHVRGGNPDQDPTAEENSIGRFMSQRLSGIEWKVCSILWGPRLGDDRGQAVVRIKNNYQWSKGKVQRFEEYILERVALEVV